MGAWLAGLGAAYLLGTFPSAYLFSRWIGKVDVRAVGSGNVGGMNALRNVHPLVGLLTVAADVLKAVGAVAFARGLAPGSLLPWLAPACVVLGHNWMPWIGFKGGKGVAAAAGSLLLLDGRVFLAAFATIGLLSFFFRNTDMGGALGIFAAPLAAAFLYGSGPALSLLALAAAVAAKHRPEVRSS